MKKEEKKGVSIIDVWSLAVVVIIFFLTFQLFRFFGRYYPAIPEIPEWISISYVIMQIINRVPIGYKWINNVYYYFERILFVYSLVLFSVFIFTKEIKDSEFLLLSTVVTAFWLIFRFFLSINHNEYNLPLRNRVYGALYGTFVDSPLFLMSYITYMNYA